MTETATAPQGDDWEAVADKLAAALALISLRLTTLDAIVTDVLGEWRDAKERAEAGDSAA